MMVWMNMHKRVWRAAILVLLLVALIGPWAYDLINVPAEFACSAPFVRLEGDFCGKPIPGFWILGKITSVVAGAITGTMAVTGRLRELFFGLLGLLFVLPVFTTLFLILSGDRPYQKGIHFAALGITVGLGLLLAMSYTLIPFWLLWGPWLYVGLAVSALVLEGAVFASGRRVAER